jgi:hypothetical protein
MVSHSSRILHPASGKTGSGLEPPILPVKDKAVARRLIRFSPREMTASLGHSLDAFAMVIREISVAGYSDFVQHHPDRTVFHRVAWLEMAARV